MKIRITYKNSAGEFVDTIIESEYFWAHAEIGRDEIANKSTGALMTADILDGDKASRFWFTVGINSFQKPFAHTTALKKTKETIKTVFGGWVKGLTGIGK